MPVKRLLILFSIIHNGSIEPVSDLIDGKGVGKFIGKLVRNEVAKDLSNHVHNVAFIRLESGGKSCVFDEVVQELSEDVPLLLPITGRTINDHSIWDTSFVIIITDYIEFRFLVNNLFTNFSTSDNRNDIKFILVATNRRYNFRLELVDFFISYGIVNYVIITCEDDWRVFSYYPIEQHGNYFEMSDEAVTVWS